MKTRLTLVLCLALANFARADGPAAPPLATPEGVRLTAGQLEQLTAPIALYPDALIALILPASTAPADIVLAARYLKDDGNPADVASRSWDESVKSLVHYAEVVQWLDDNLAWTKQLGEAFNDQPAEVMNAIQRLRAKARTAGLLADSPQQQILADNNLITIIPAQPDVIYVPYYDPAMLYGPPDQFYGAPGAPFLTFSPGFAIGSWLAFDLDWRRHNVWVAEHHWAQRDHRDWRHPVFPGTPGYVNDPNRHPWHPSANLPHATIVTGFRPDNIARPSPINAPPRPGFAPDRTIAMPGQPPRNDDRRRDPNFNRGVAITPTSPAPAVTPAPAAPPASHRSDPGRPRNDSVEPSRTLAWQNPPNAAASNRPATAPQVAPAPNNYSPSSPRIVPAFTGPVVAPLPSIHVPNAAPAPAPVAPLPPAAVNDRKQGVNESGEPRKQLN
jgi:hypothetical protein